MTATDGSGTTGGPPSSFQRFARGEIDVDEYTRRREVLRSGS